MSDAAAEPKRLVVSGLAKSFGGAAALSDATLEVLPGEIHALLGQNGAGKSTLMNVLAGDVRADAGSMLLDGAPFTPESPLSARRAGVVMVHQELSLCPHLTVAENVMLTNLPTRGGLLDRAEMKRRAREALAPLAAPGGSDGGGWRSAPNYRESARDHLAELDRAAKGAAAPDQAQHGIDVDARTGDLPPAAQQLVEIARALTEKGCKVLILDEPTSSLAHADVERLFAVLRRLRKASGLSVLYVSHFLEEVKAIADGFTVLRDGRTVASGRVAAVTAAELVEQMAGRPVEQLFPRSARSPGEVVLRVDDLAGARAPRRASFEVRRGEVLGIAGLVGAGRTELLRGIFGLDAVRAGAIRVLAFEPSTSSSPSARLAESVGMLSEDRKAEGLCLGLSIADNLTLSRLEGLGPGPIVSTDRQAAKAAEWMAKLGVRARGPAQRISELSGGNQQKVAIARLLHHDVDVLLLDEPTRGVDVEAKAQIYALIDELAARGKAVVLVSSYLPELVGVCDRIHVMSRGVLGPSRDAKEATEASLLAEAAGA